MKTILMMLLLLSAPLVSAGELAELLEKELLLIQNNVERPIPLRREESYFYELTRIRVRVRTTVGVEIPYLAGLEIRPSIEFFFD